MTPENPRIRRVKSFQELIGTSFAKGVNALCWPRVLRGNFGEVVEELQAIEEITSLSATLLESLTVSAAGRMAIDTMSEDLRLLRAADLMPELNCIRAYPYDHAPGPVRTDVYSFHVDSAPVETDTWLCTYHGAASQGLNNDEAQRWVDRPETRAALLQQFGGADGDEFLDYLSEHSYDLHYASDAHAKPFSFGLGNLWRIAVEYPGSPVLPCIHRAPETVPGESARLLLIC